MNINRKIQFSAAAVIANGVLALSLLSSAPALAGICRVEECTTQAYCAAHNNTNKYCPPPPIGCSHYVGQTACSAGPITDILDPCYAWYAYFCEYY
jgi:hypothetical protein